MIEAVKALKNGKSHGTGNTSKINKSRGNIHSRIHLEADEYLADRMDAEGMENGTQEKVRLR
jgi:hypothetical protein